MKNENKKDKIENDNNNNLKYQDTEHKNLNAENEL